MPSDPTTKDLIEAAREESLAQRPDAGCGCADCLLTALADRLEEVEEERDRLNAGFIRATGVLRSIIRNARTTTHQTKSVLENIVRDVRNSNREGGDTDDRGPREPTPDPDVTPGESGLAPWCAHCGGTWPCRNPRCLRPRRSHAKRLPDSPEPSDPEPDHITRTYEFAEDPEPEDDPWEEIELVVERHRAGTIHGAAVHRALVDLRKRVKDVEREDTTQDLRIDRIRDRLDTLESRLNTLLGEHNRLSDRLTTLEGHADRGSGAVTALEDRVAKLDYAVFLALRARSTLRDDLEKIEDFMEALAERVERLEAEGPEQAAP